MSGPRRALLRTLLTSSGAAALAAVGLSLWVVSDGLVSRTIGGLLLLAALVMVVVRKRTAIVSAKQPGLLATYVSVRALLIIAVGSGYLLRRPDDRWWIGAALAVTLGTVLLEPGVKTALSTNAQKVVHLRGVPSMPRPRVQPGWLTTCSLATTVLGALLAGVAAPGWLFLLVALPAVPLLLLTLVHAAAAHKTAARIQRQLSPALARHAPEFAVYYAAIQGAQYQLGMWLPYLERLNRPFVVIARNPAAVGPIAKLTRAPVISPRTTDVLPSIDQLVVPSLKAAFYVQGSPGNSAFQRYRKLTHVWLNHGDSDKQANYHQRHATYDKVFVSGQLGIDRYAAHGITIPPEKFVIVGRPQIETIEVRDSVLPPDAPRTVLYAPTWQGGRPSTNYSSMAWGEQIVTALLERGVTVLFRPHPLTWTDTTDAGRARRIHSLLSADAEATNRRHGWGRKIERDWDIPACANAADALITDVSSVASDFLASGKPFAMVATKDTADNFRKEFAMARAAYVIEQELANLDEVLHQLLGPDTMRLERLAYRGYCLGGPVGPSAAELFLEHARRIVDGER